MRTQLKGGTMKKTTKKTTKKPTKKPAPRDRGSSSTIGRTQTMPSGAQQYVRGDSTNDRLRTLNRIRDSDSVRNTPGARGPLADAFLDEVDAYIEGYESSRRQKAATPKKMKKGGRVRGDGICQRGKTKGRMR